MKPQVTKRHHILEVQRNFYTKVGRQKQEEEETGDVLTQINFCSPCCFGVLFQAMVQLALISSL